MADDANSASAESPPINMQDVVAKGRDGMRRVGLRSKEGLTAWCDIAAALYDARRYRSPEGEALTSDRFVAIAAQIGIKNKTDAYDLARMHPHREAVFARCFADESAASARGKGYEYPGWKKALQWFVPAKEKTKTERLPSAKVLHGQVEVWRDRYERAAAEARKLANQAGVESLVLNQLEATIAQEAEKPIEAPVTQDDNASAPDDAPEPPPKSNADKAVRIVAMGKDHKPCSFDYPHATRWVVNFCDDPGKPGGEYVKGTDSKVTAIKTAYKVGREKGLPVMRLMIEDGKRFAVAFREESAAAAIRQHVTGSHGEPKRDESVTRYCRNRHHDWVSHHGNQVHIR